MQTERRQKGVAVCRNGPSSEEDCRPAWAVGGEAPFPPDWSVVLSVSVG